MKRINNKFVNSVGGFLNKNAPTIMTGFAVAGVFATAVSAVQSTPKALQIIELRNLEREEDELEPLTNLEIIKATYTCYIPAMSFATLTTACIIGSNVVNLRRQVALASMYGLTETAFREYREKVIANVGESVHRKVREDIAEDHMKSASSNENLVFIGNGEVLCFDDTSGRFFKSEIVEIEKAVIQLNKNLRNDMRIPLNDLYYALGIPEITLGEKYGWELDTDAGTVEVDFSSKITENNTPCIVMTCNAKVIEI